MAMVLLLISGSSGFSIITAHELIHRRNRGEQALGRLLLCSVLYEHFYTEHLRGHHARVGTPSDPATARFGEGYEAFFRRTVPAQFRSAWRLEKRRLGAPEMGLWDRRMLRNRILHGLVLEWGVAIGILLAFGLPSFVAFVVQAFMAIRLLEAVNYFEHWGLTRSGARVRPVDSWDTHSWFTYYGLIGLSRHADHHAWPARPYQQLRVYEEAPVLPMGYVGMVDLVMAQNQIFQEQATAELARRKLGPFSAASDAALEARPIDPEEAARRLVEAQARETGAAPAAGRWKRAWTAMPPLGRRLALLALVVVLTSVGVRWETGGDPLSFSARLGLHAWMLAAIALMLYVAHRVREARDHESLAFGIGFALLASLGLLGDALLGLF
jgi:hypothetical protein